MQIIAEIANSHQGSLKILYQLLRKLRKNKIINIKFQIYFAEELMVKNHTRFLHFKKQSFSPVEWEKIIKFSKKYFKVYVDVFGLKAFKIARKLKVDGYKIHSSDLLNRELLISVAKTNKHVFLSVGGANGFEISYALKNLKRTNVILMHGFQNYPTNLSDVNLNRIKWLQKNYTNILGVGYQDHTDGEKFIDCLVTSMTAISKGALFLEKHVTLSRNLKIDASSSFEPIEFKKYQSEMDRYLKIFGKKNFKFSNSEKKYRNTVTKYLVSVKNILPNSRIKNSQIKFKRINYKKKIYCPNIEDFLDKNSLNKINVNTPLNLSLIKNKINALIIVRLKSNRLKKKAVLKINNEYVIEHLINKVKKIKNLNKIIICTSVHYQDDQLIKIAKKNNINFFRGHETNVLKRMYDCNQKFKCDHCLRITGDDILIDPFYANKTIQYHLETNSDYTDCKKLPSGTEVEVFSNKAINNLFNSLIDGSGTEYLTNYITENSDHFNKSSCKVFKKHQIDARLTIDTKEDFFVVKKMIEYFKKEKKDYSYNLDDIVSFYMKNKKLFKKNRNIKQLIKPESFSTSLDWN